jgi:hypothetical protein
LTKQNVFNGLVTTVIAGLIVVWSTYVTVQAAQVVDLEARIQITLDSVSQQFTNIDRRLERIENKIDRQ